MVLVTSISNYFTNKPSLLNKWISLSSSNSALQRKSYLSNLMVAHWHKTKVAKGSSINDVGPFFRIYDPLLPLVGSLRRRCLWMAPKGFFFVKVDIKKILWEFHYRKYFTALWHCMPHWSCWHTCILFLWSFQKPFLNENVLLLNCYNYVKLPSYFIDH